jgi:hypothetical protein
MTLILVDIGALRVLPLKWQVIINGRVVAPNEWCPTEVGRIPVNAVASINGFDPIRALVILKMLVECRAGARHVVRLLPLNDARKSDRRSLA